jgi:zinc protease
VQGRGQRLLAYALYTGDPGFIAKDLARYQAADAAALQKYTAQFLKKNNRVVITVDPNPQAPIMGRVKS